MKNLCVKLLLLVFLISCKNEISQEIKIDVLNDFEFVLNGVEYTIDNFEEAFRSNSKLIVGKSNKKYDVVLRVYDGVEMKTLQRMKVEFSKAKDNIDEIKYSHEN